MRDNGIELEFDMKELRRDHGTELGDYLIGDSQDILSTKLNDDLEGRVQLILTSPPFPLNNKKSYGNLQGEEYLDWLREMAPVWSRLLTRDGSIVIELGNAWEPGRPVQSLLPLQALMSLVQHPDANLRLCQQFVCYNPSRLPSPANWVTVNRIRVTDSYTNVWWLSKSDYPKADNRRILRPYSKSMQKLHERGSYNHGKRSSEHNIGETSFLTDNGGSIAHNFLEMEQLDERREVRLPNALSMANTSSKDYFLRTCRERGITAHPARMQVGLAEMFIQFLTDENDLVVDPFGGSNTTGFAAEKNMRRWISIEMQEKYAEQSRIRLGDPVVSEKIRA